MRHPRVYTAVLALLLIGQCWLFNWLEQDPHRVSIFPWLIGLVPVPVVMFLALRQRVQSSGAATGSELRRFAWSVLWPASLAFGCFAAVFSAVNFGLRALPIVLFSFFAALVATLVVGVGSTEVVALVIRRASPATPHRAA